MNVLLIFSDQQHRYSLGCMGNAQVQTPNLDRLAAGGVLFRRCYSNDPICGPFRGTLMTGQYSSHCRVTRNESPLPQGTTTFADAFNAGGYRTCFVGKWHLGATGNGPIAPELRGGFGGFIGYQCYNGFYKDVNFYDEAGREHHFDRHRTDVTTDLAIERLTAMGRDKFAMVVAYQAPHYPVQPAPQYAALYEGLAVQRRANCREVDPHTPTFSPRSPRPREDDPDFQRYGHKLDEYIRLYYGMCSQIDANVGRLLATLDRLGLADDTLVLYTSDHGDMQGSHGLTNKCLPYEESAGIPLIARLPGSAAGRVCDGLVSGIDLMPTCLDLAGLAVPPGVDGDSLAPYLRGRASLPDRDIFSERADWCMICRGKWKLVAKRKASDPLQPTMLFDVQTDPYELANLVDAPAQAPVLADLLQSLESWRQRVGSV